MRFQVLAVVALISWISMAEDSTLPANIPGLPRVAKFPLAKPMEIKAPPAVSAAAKSIDLESRFSARAIALSAEIPAMSISNHPLGFFEQESVKRILVEPGEANTAWVVWPGSDNVTRVTRLDDSLQYRRGDDCLLQGRFVKDVQSDGATLLVLSLGPANQYELIRLGELKGECVTFGHSYLKTQGKPNHPAALAISPNKISVVAGETDRIMSAGDSEISREWSLVNGNIQPTGLHKSIPMSFVGLSNAVTSSLFVEIGGPYPTSSLALVDRGREHLIAPIYTDHQGHTSTRLADAGFAGNKIVVAYQDASDANLAIMAPKTATTSYTYDIEFNGKIAGAPKEATNLHVASLSPDRILVGWQYGLQGRVYFGQYDTKGTPIGQPQELAAMLQPGGRIRKLTNGDLVWGAVNPKNRKHLIIYRIKP